MKLFLATLTLIGLAGCGSKVSEVAPAQAVNPVPESDLPSEPMTHLHEDDPFRRFGRRTDVRWMASAHVPKILV
jgi:hypothetical protein